MARRSHVALSSVRALQRGDAGERHRRDRHGVVREGPERGGGRIDRPRAVPLPRLDEPTVCLVEPALVERAVAHARLDLWREPGRRGVVEHVDQGLEHHAGGVDGAAYQQIAPDADLGRHDLGAVREPPADLLGHREVVEHLGIAVAELGARADGALRPDHEFGQVPLVAPGHRRRQFQRPVEQLAGLGVAGRRLRRLGRHDVGRDGLRDVAGQVPVVGDDGEIAG